MSCDGTLAGNEASFAGITRSSANLVDGTVMLAPVSATVVRLSGLHPDHVWQASIDLTRTPRRCPRVPQTIWERA